ncbi:glycosyltransferase family 2 protein [Paenimyroides ceti]
MNKTLTHKLIGLIITRNEEKNIPALVENLSFLDEIVIVDSCSTDNSKEIVQQYPQIRFYENQFENYSAQRNKALEYVEDNWILFLDADERISEALKEEIIDTVNNNDRTKAYYFKRRFYFNNKPVFFCGLQSDKNIRLFYKNDQVHYQGFVHEKIQFRGTFNVLQNHLTHYSYENYTSYKKKMHRYGTLKALEKIEKGEKPNLFLKYSHPVYTFLSKYLLRLGILDGYKGFILCYLMSYSVYVRYAEIEKQSKKRHDTISSRI